MRELPLCLQPVPAVGHWPPSGQGRRSVGGRALVGVRSD